MVLYTYVLDRQVSYYGAYYGANNHTLVSNLHHGKVNAINNTHLRQLSNHYDICKGLYGILPNQAIKKHTPCADSIEALLGAMYVQYGIRRLEQIFVWLDMVFPQLAKKLYFADPTIPIMNGPDLAERHRYVNPRASSEKGPKILPVSNTNAQVNYYCKGPDRYICDNNLKRVKKYSKIFPAYCKLHVLHNLDPGDDIECNIINDEISAKNLTSF